MKFSLQLGFGNMIIIFLQMSWPLRLLLYHSKGDRYKDMWSTFKWNYDRLKNLTKTTVVWQYLFTFYKLNKYVLIHCILDDNWTFNCLVKIVLNTDSEVNSTTFGWPQFNIGEQIPCMKYNYDMTWHNPWHWFYRLTYHLHKAV